MTTTPDCSHDDVEFSPEITVIDDPPFMFAALSVRCATCNVRFHWRGVNSAHPNPLEPSCSADGFILYAPIAPGPGSIVGLLERTGLGDRLVAPNGR